MRCKFLSFKFLLGYLLMASICVGQEKMPTDFETAVNFYKEELSERQRDVAPSYLPMDESSRDDALIKAGLELQDLTDTSSQSRGAPTSSSDPYASWGVQHPIDTALKSLALRNTPIFVNVLHVLGGGRLGISQQQATAEQRNDIAKMLIQSAIEAYRWGIPVDTGASFFLRPYRHRAKTEGDLTTTEQDHLKVMTIIYAAAYTLAENTANALLSKQSIFDQFTAAIYGLNATQSFIGRQKPGQTMSDPYDFLRKGADHPFLDLPATVNEQIDDFIKSRVDANQIVSSLQHVNFAENYRQVLREAKGFKPGTRPLDENEIKAMRGKGVDVKPSSARVTSTRSETVTPGQISDALRDPGKRSKQGSQYFLNEILPYLNDDYQADGWWYLATYGGDGTQITPAGEKMCRVLAQFAQQDHDIRQAVFAALAGLNKEVPSLQLPQIGFMKGQSIKYMATFEEQAQTLGKNDKFVEGAQKKDKIVQKLVEDFNDAFSILRRDYQEGFGIIGDKDPRFWSDDMEDCGKAILGRVYARAESATALGKEKLFRSVMQLFKQEDPMENIHAVLLGIYEDLYAKYGASPLLVGKMRYNLYHKKFLGEIFRILTSQWGPIGSETWDKGYQQFLKSHSAFQHIAAGSANPMPITNVESEGEDLKPVGAPFADKPRQRSSGPGQREKEVRQVAAAAAYPYGVIDDYWKRTGNAPR